MENTRFKVSQYVCAMLLIVSSIALVAYQVIHIDDVAAGLDTCRRGRTVREVPHDFLVDARKVVFRVGWIVAT